MSNVKPLNWNRVKEIFEAVLAQPFAERDAFLDRTCAGDHALRDEVESLIKSYEQAQSFMEAPAVQSAADSFVENKNRLAPGQRISHYEILDSIGEGGMGEVYVARDTKLGRRVALKILPEYFTHDRDRLRRFNQEARASSVLSHPNICVIHEVGQSEAGQPFIAMEYIEGLTLRHRMDEGPLALTEVLDIAGQIAEALTVAHDAGIVHRDIKPENIMLRRDGYVKVLDFGLAKLTEKARGYSSETATTLMRTSTPGLVMGTVAYMSPEQARGVPVDSRTDIWSLGVVIYEMLSGQPPFRGETPTDVVIAIVEKDQQPLGEFVSDTPPELERIVKKTLRKDRDERYQFIKELAIDLRALRREVQSEEEASRAMPQRTAAPTKKRYDTKEVDARKTIIERPGTPSFGRYTRVAFLGLLVILVGAIAFLGYKLFSRNKSTISPQHFARINVTKLTTNGNAVYAAISRDGKYVAYVMSEAGQQSLWLRQVAVDSNIRLVPSREGRYLGIAFSPDGNYIYYGYVGAGADDRPELYRVPVLAMGATATRMSLYNGPPSASHDGKRVAFFHYDQTQQADTLVVADSDGSNERTLTTRKWPSRFGWSWNATPLWSSNDRRLSCVLVESDANFLVQLYDIDVADGAEHTIPLTGQRFELVDDVGLLPDGSGVILTAKAQGASFFQLWELSRDGSAKQITNDLSDHLGLSMTGDATTLLTIQRQVLSNIWSAPKGDGAHATQLTSGVGRYFDVAWTNDGKILYASDASGSANVYEMEPDGSKQKILTDAGRNYAPAVSRDGRYIVFHSNRSGRFQIWRTDRDGSNPKQLTNLEQECNWPQFSTDGRWVIFQHFDAPEAGSLWRVPVDGGKPEKITDGIAIRPAVSPDGKWIGCWVREKNEGRVRLGLIPSTGGAPVKLFDVAPSVQVSWDVVIRWNADSTALSYVDRRSGVGNVWLQPIAGGSPLEASNFKDSWIFSFDWSPDNRLLASRGVETNDVVLLREAK